MKTVCIIVKSGNRCALFIFYFAYVTYIYTKILANSIFHFYKDLETLVPILYLMRCSLAIQENLMRNN